MDLDLVFLGTSGSAPTPARAPAALLVRRGGERLLFDCAEGTQRQLMRSAVGLPDLEQIFLTHFHADHYLGLPGMLKTFQLRQRELPLTDLRAAGAPRSLRRAAPRLRQALLPAGARRGADGGGARPRRLPDPRLPRAPRRLGRRVRARRARPARPLRQRHRRRARASRSGPSAARLQRGESITLPDGRVADARRRARARRGPAAASSSRATPRPSRRCECSRRAPTCSCTRRRFSDEERERAADTLHSTATPGRRDRPRRRRAAAGADAHLAALLRPRPGARGARDLPGDGRARATSTRSPSRSPSEASRRSSRAARRTTPRRRLHRWPRSSRAAARRRRGEPAPRARPSSARSPTRRRCRP